MQSPGLADKVAVLPFNHPGLIATTLIGRIRTIDMCCTASPVSDSAAEARMQVMLCRSSLQASALVCHRKTAGYCHTPPYTYAGMLRVLPYTTEHMCMLLVDNQMCRHAAHAAMT